MENLQKIKDKLPHGYSKILKNRMFQKHNISMSEASIRRALMEKHLNQQVLEQALVLIEELKKKKEALNKRISNF